MRMLQSPGVEIEVVGLDAVRKDHTAGGHLRFERERSVQQTAPMTIEASEWRLTNGSRPRTTGALPPTDAHRLDWRASEVGDDSRGLVKNRREPSGAAGAGRHNDAARRLVLSHSPKRIAITGRDVRAGADEEVVEASSR